MLVAFIRPTVWFEWPDLDAPFRAVGPGVSTSGKVWVWMCAHVCLYLDFDAEFIAMLYRRELLGKTHSLHTHTHLHTHIHTHSHTHRRLPSSSCPCLVWSSSTSS